jgi:hypothetical protein
MNIRLFGYVGLALALGGCGPPHASRSLYAARSAPWAKTSAPVRMLFGGVNHKTYLGCLTCDTTAAESIFNSSGRFGHCSGWYSNDNVYCHSPLSSFGSTGFVTPKSSACGAYASDPPVIVDQYGQYYGRFSIGELLGHNDSPCKEFGRAHSELLCKIVTRVCEVDSWSS